MHGILSGTGDKFGGWAEFGALTKVGELPTGMEGVRRKRAPLDKLKGVKPTKKRRKKKKHRGNPY